MPTAAQLACAPVIAAIGGGTSLVAIPANLLAAPAVAPATVLGVIVSLIAPVSASAAAGVAGLAGLPCWWLLVVAHTGARLPAASVPWPGGVDGGLLLAAVTVLLPGVVRRLGRLRDRGRGAPPAGSDRAILRR